MNKFIPLKNRLKLTLRSNSNQWGPYSSRIFLRW